MQITPIQTRIVTPPSDDIYDVLGSVLGDIPERSVIAITSKIISICEGRCVSMSDVDSKDGLIRQEADQWLSRDQVPGRWVMHTITDNLLVPSAGIDASNTDGYYVLWPEDSKKSAHDIWQWIRNQYNLDQVGVVIVDSHSVPLRRGVVGVSLGHYGFSPLNDYRGQTDLFGRPFHVSQTNVADGLAAAAVLSMGEGAECTPVAVMSDIPGVQFGDWHEPDITGPHSSFRVLPQDDLYAPFINNVNWKDRNE